MMCARCGGRGSDWHHRRSRRVRAEHRHCSCNGLLLCRSCHSWAHREPSEAKASGYVVAQWTDEPGTVPHLRIDGWWVSGCEGDLRPVLAVDIVTDGVGGVVYAPA